LNRRQYSLPYNVYYYFENINFPKLNPNVK
jgi:hypothetical protein